MLNLDLRRFHLRGTVVYLLQPTEFSCQRPRNRTNYLRPFTRQWRGSRRGPDSGCEAEKRLLRELADATSATAAAVGASEA